MKQLIGKMNDLTSRGEPFVLATVITRNGSAPRSAGARMLIQPDGATAGTVGGGILEAQVQRLAGEIMESHTSVVKNFKFSGKDAATMDAICGGQVDVLVEWVNSADPAWKAVLESITASAARQQKTWLLTSLPGYEQTALAHAVVQKDGSTLGSFPAGLPVDSIYAALQPDLLTVNDQRWLVEPLVSGGAVFIFGAGHVGRSLAAFTRAVGFWTVVLDDRPEYANPQNIPAANEVIVLDCFEDAINSLTIDSDSFIVIVTRGHLNDRVVLAQALKTNAGYIGMIGSRRKCALVFDELRKSGFNDNDIQRVHAPIGLSIQAETPEEIGISITAEMIQVRANLAGSLSS